MLWRIEGKGIHYRLVLFSLSGDVDVVVIPNVRV